mmetsp:Transcript_42217/g.99097  ORF Transcript_42217/g.99097 Transcript_42217/m.99097 type:complete len:251 (-) Transcript_42217:384-1136(-)
MTTAVVMGLTASAWSSLAAAAEEVLPSDQASCSTGAYSLMQMEMQRNRTESFSPPHHDSIRPGGMSAAAFSTLLRLDLVQGGGVRALSFTEAAGVLRILLREINFQDYIIPVLLALLLFVLCTALLVWCFCSSSAASMTENFQRGGRAAAKGKGHRKGQGKGKKGKAEDSDGAEERKCLNCSYAAPAGRPYCCMRCKQSPSLHGPQCARKAFAASQTATTTRGLSEAQSLGGDKKGSSFAAEGEVAEGGA